jgi:rod shape determining protein RodA
MKRLLSFDWLLLVSALFLLGTGLLSLYSISSITPGTSWSGSYVVRQTSFAVLGLIIMAVLAFLDYRHIEKFSTTIFFFSAFLLLSVLVLGKVVRGTTGWISFGAINFQPVEGAKIALILFLASFISKKTSELGEWVRIITSLVLSSLFIFLVLKQPDLGSAIVLTAIWGGMIIASGIRMKHVFVLLVLGVVLSVSGWFFLAGYQRARLEVFIHPERDPRGSGYNVLQSMVAVGSGGVFGKGVGYGSQSQLNFLPEKHTDFIFAVIGEELGLVGVGMLFFAYGTLFYRIYRIGRDARDNFGYFVALGAFIFFFVQVVINIGMNIGVLPVTGLPAPFLSYGGSSLLASFALVGILLGISRRGKEQFSIHSLSLDSESEIHLRA